MPRTSKTVAQRLGTPTRSRRRRFQRVDEAETPIVAPVATPVAAASAGPRVDLPRTVSAPVAPRTPTARRRYADYASEYAYVPGDLRRIVVVGGGLLVFLLALSLVVR